MFVPTIFSEEESGAVDVGDIGHSLRFAASRSCYMSRVWGTPSNNLKWAILFWLRRGVMGTTTPIFSAGDGSSNTSFYIEFLNTDTIIIRQLSGGVDSLYATTSAVFRDPTGFVPFLLYYDSANATAADRIQLWQGDASVGSSGKRLTLNYTTGPFAQNTASQANVNGRTHYWGKLDFAGIYGDFYLARSCFFDNSNPSLTSLMQVNSTINEFVTLTQSTVKAVVEAAGAQSSMLDFDNGSSTTTLGYDKSSKGNNWTLNNFSLTAGTTYDHMLDVPGNSYPVINTLLPVNSTAPTVSEANLKWSRGSTAPGWTAASMPLPQTDKLYWETDHTSSLNGAPLWTGVVNSTRGAADDNANNIAGVQTDTTWNGRLTNGSTIATYLNPGGLNAVVAHAYDGATGKYWCGYVSGGSITWGTNGGVGDPAAGTNALETLSGVVTPAFGQFQTAGATRTITEYFNAGQRPFSASALPTGFKALCQANLSDTGTVTVSGSFAGNLNADGPCVWMNGVPKTLSINGNAVTFGTHADKLATGFKVRTASSSYNNSGSNTWTATIDSNLQNIFKYNNAEGNP